MAVRSQHSRDGFNTALLGILLWPAASQAQVALCEISGSHGADAPFHGYVAFLDYSAAPGIEPVVIRPAATACGRKCERPMAPLVTTYEFAQQSGAFLAVNGSFSNSAPQGYDVCGCLRVWGPVKSDGKLLWGLTERGDDQGNPALLFGRNGRPEIRMARAADIRRARNAIGGEWKNENSPAPERPGTLLMQDGIELGTSALPVPLEVAPRTAAGLTAEGVLIVVVVEGRLPGFSAGITLPDLASLVASFGARDAVNLDGGGSTAMIYRPLGTPVVETRKLNDAMHSKPPAGAAISFTLRQRSPLEAFTSRPCDAKPNELFRPTTIHWGFRAKAARLPARR